jgi:hypothetical protein
LETPSRRAAADTPPASATATNVCRSSMFNSAFLVSRHSVPD